MSTQQGSYTPLIQQKHDYFNKEKKRKEKKRKEKKRKEKNMNWKYWLILIVLVFAVAINFFY